MSVGIQPRLERRMMELPGPACKDKSCWNVAGGTGDVVVQVFLGRAGNGTWPCAGFGPNRCWVVRPKAAPRPAAMATVLMGCRRCEGAAVRDNSFDVPYTISFGIRNVTRAQGGLLKTKPTAGVCAPAGRSHVLEISAVAHPDDAKPMSV